jgi:hypothetical protein
VCSDQCGVDHVYCHAYRKVAKAVYAGRGSWPREPRDNCTVVISYFVCVFRITRGAFFRCFSFQEINHNSEAVPFKIS